MQSTVPLLLSFVLVCLLECVAGWMLWNGMKSGAIVALALLPISQRCIGGVSPCRFPRFSPRCGPRSS